MEKSVTHEDHSKELKRLEKARATKREQSKGPGKTLSQKLALLTEVKALDEKIFQHKLNYHSLVS